MQALLERLLAGARDAQVADTVLFARLIAARLASGDLAALGLGREAFAALMARHFPGAIVEAALPEQPLEGAPPFAGELIALLLRFDHPATPAEAADAQCLATLLAAACLRPDHLWRDLGLSGRDDVSDLLTRHYPELVVRNTANLRWKAFLAQEVALAHGRLPGPAPGCPGCEDFGHCFPALAARRA
ncbi:nitrogen fixation protein NifQ [uncultured Ralstonia sp.]|mgnify:CR=1 FL=1|uniref:nitrogen fixation protein NifQ n=1 Tax=uncultured Ralstonia sp. TaxID=114715 RepID=UPI0025EEC959|nr:nitrogen fixation protein NifQ [uncultured Ralstonia sp.]